MDKKPIPLPFPVGGLSQRLAYQVTPPFTTPDALNVRPDESILGRERGGRRPGLGKAFAQQLGGGNPIRMASTVTYTPSAGGNSINRLVASANGLLYRESPLGAMELVVTSATLASDRQLQATEYKGKLYIADVDDAIIEASDGAITSTNQFATASLGAADIYNYALVIEEGGTGANQKQTITSDGDTATGGTFTLSIVVDANKYTTVKLPYNTTAAKVTSALNRVLRDEDGTAIGTVTSTGGPLPGTAIVVTFAGGMANTDNNLMVVNSANLTAADGDVPAYTAAITTAGGPAEAGTYDITAVGATLTIDPPTKNATGITFRIQRCPKIYDPAANTLTKWVATLGSVPIGRALICTWRARLVLAGGDVDPHGWDMCRLDAPLDFDYSQVDDAGAVAGTSSDAGLFQLPATALIPHSDECLIVPCVGEMWVMRGDPKTGGRIPRLSSEIGAIDAITWCYTPEGYLFILGLDGLYVMPPGCGSTPQSVSREKLPEELLNIDRSRYTVSMRYDVRDRGIHLFRTRV